LLSSRQTLPGDCPTYFDHETRLLEAPMVIRVADQVPLSSPYFPPSAPPLVPFFPPCYHPASLLPYKNSVQFVESISVLLLRYLLVVQSNINLKWTALN